MNDIIKTLSTSAARMSELDAWLAAAIAERDALDEERQTINKKISVARDERCRIESQLRELMDGLSTSDIVATLNSHYGRVNSQGSGMAGLRAEVTGRLHPGPSRPKRKSIIEKDGRAVEHATEWAYFAEDYRNAAHRLNVGLTGRSIKNDRERECVWLTLEEIPHVRHAVKPHLYPAPDWAPLERDWGYHE